MDFSDFETGDIILFHGSRSIVSSFIEFFSGSQFSHIGIVLKNPKFIDPLLEDGYYLLESGLEDFPDSEDHKIKYGVQIVPLQEKLESYTGTYCVRHLDCVRNEEFYNKINSIHRSIHNKPYDLCLTDWIKAFFGWTFGNVQKTNEFWCSALVSFIYVKMNFLPDDVDWTIIKPSYFNQQNLPLQNCHLSNEIWL